MAAFDDASRWLKLALMFSALCLLLILAAVNSPGWADDPGVGCGGTVSCGRQWYSGTEGCEVVGVLCSLTSFILVVCCVWLDELPHRKAILACIVAFSLGGGLVTMVGVIIYGVNTTGSPYAILLTVLSGTCAILCGTFSILHAVTMTTP